MDGMDEWRFVDSREEEARQERERYEQQRKVEKKNTYCNIIRDYGKLREIAAKIINALDIKDEEADEITQYDIRALYVDDSYTNIDIQWIEVFDRGETGELTRERVETVPADWFALDESNLQSVVKSYKKHLNEAVENLKRDLDAAIEDKMAADERITEIKRRLSNLEGY